MMQSERETLLSDADAASEPAKILPLADAYFLEELSRSGAADAARSAKLKKTLGAQGLNPRQLDNLLAEIFLLRQSSKAAEHKVEVLKSRAALEEICESLSLSPDYRALLLDYFAAPAGKELFTQTRGGPAEQSKTAFARTIDELLETAQELDADAAPRMAANKNYINALFNDKKIPPSVWTDLLAAYGARGAADFAAGFGEITKKLAAINDNPAQNAILACRVLLHNITAEEAAFCAQTAAAVKYALQDDDLQTIALKYAGRKTPAEIAEIFEAVLKRLPYLDDPAENLGSAARIVADARPQTLREEELHAAQRKGKVLFMRKLAADKFFAGYEDELTNKFFGQNSIEEISSMFHHILKELPHGGDIYENADIAVKVLLKKLPLKDGINQASFKKENRKEAAAGGLEQEAFESYLGTKNKDEILEFFKQKFADFTFWHEDDDKHCCAMSILVEELNGKITPAAADLALFLLEAGYPADSAEIIASGLGAAAEIDKNDVSAAYEKFYADGNDHADAARRTVNMLQ
ncbi:MAG: hypothetical protein LBL61_02200 [Elusimicrobiota bacterium]|jgi:hypothetical protein|nr:hypothetical protein [Elusimicrobiota bacterium]